MKAMYRVVVTNRTKSKKKNKTKTSKDHTPASIAQRYMEIRRLRERISEAESRAYAQ